MSEFLQIKMQCYYYKVVKVIFDTQLSLYYSSFAIIYILSYKVLAS